MHQWSLACQLHICSEVFVDFCAISFKIDQFEPKCCRLWTIYPHCSLLAVDSPCTSAVSELLMVTVSSIRLYNKGCNAWLHLPLLLEDTTLLCAMSPEWIADSITFQAKHSWWFLTTYLAYGCWQSTFSSPTSVSQQISDFSVGTHRKKYIFKTDSGLQRSLRGYVTKWHAHFTHIFFCTAINILEYQVKYDTSLGGVKPVLF